MTIDYIRIPLEILQDKNLSDKQKMLLGLVISFESEGLHTSNGKLAELLGLNAAYVSQLISDLEKKKYIRITGAQSKYRKIYFEKNLKVESDLLLEKPQSKDILLLEKPKHTLRKTSNITKRTKDNIYNPQFFNDLWKAYPNKQSKTDAEKAFKKLNPDEKMFSQIMTALKKHKLTEQWQKENGKYIPYPATWLNKRRFDDELPELDGCGIVQTADCDPDEAELLREQKKAAGF